MLFILIVFYSKGISQNWLNLNATGNWVSCGNLNITGNQVTVEALINMTSTSVDIVSKHTSPGDVNYLFRPSAFSITTGTGYNLAPNSLTLALNTTYHVAGVYDGSFLYYYVNGCETGKVACTGNMVQNAFFTAIGNQSNCQCEQFVGYIDEVRIWNVARTQAQIQANMNSLPSPTTQAGLLAYYSFNSGYINLQGTATYDGTLVGTDALIPNPTYVPLVPFSATTTDVNLICNGTATGSITVNATGGNTPYQYSINGGANQASNTFNNLSAGGYTVIATSAEGACVEQIPLTLTQPNPILISTTQTNPCFGLSNGSATATVSGGTGPTYTVGIIAPPQGGVTTGVQVLNNLSAGAYTVAVQDEAGCQATLPLSITQPAAALSTTTTQTNVTCFGLSNGSATTTATGGTVGYTYSWSPVGGTAATASNLPAQNYTVTVTDANLCTTTSTVAITQPALPLTTTITSTNVRCNGLSNGSATVAANGGTGPYTYSWSPVGGTAATASNLPAGTYTAIVSDFNLCSATATVNITQPPVLTLTATTTDVTCKGLSNGSATATATGGIASYTIGINSIPAQGALSATGIEAASGLPAGSYTFGVQDNNGCQVIFPITINQPLLPLSATTTQTNVSCNGLHDGSSTVTAAGGTAPYTYSWSPVGGTTVIAANLSAGTYTVAVADFNLCKTTSTITITQPATLTLSTAQSNVSCNGLSNGSSTVTAGGGTSPYTYSWSPAGGANATAANLPAGTYTVLVSDFNLCSATATVNIAQPPALTLTITQTNVSCFGLSNGSATATATGGTGPTYTVGIIAPPQGGITSGVQVLNNLSAAAYTVAVQDNNGCQSVVPLVITQPAAPLSFTTTQTNVSCKGLSNGSSTVTPSGGTAPYTYSYTPGGGILPVESNLSAQSYTIYVKDLNGCSDSATIAITEPALALKDSIVQGLTKNDSCYGAHNGVAIAGVTGGTQPYTYLWSTGSITDTASSLGKGTYTLVVADSHSCTATTTVTITQPVILKSSSMGKTICIGDSAKLVITQTGGTAPYTYFCNGTTTLQNDSIVNPTNTTTYTVEVKDVKGCTDTNMVTVVVRPPLSIKSISPDVEGCLGISVNLNATGGGGDNQYTYTWNPGGIGQFITAQPVITTIYTLTLKDACNTPTVTATVQVTVDAPPSVHVISNPAKGCYPLCAAFSSNATINSGTIQSYSWNFGNGQTSDSSKFSQCYKHAGNYLIKLTVISDKGCIARDSVVDSAYAHPKAAFDISPADITILNPNVQFINSSTAVGSSISSLLWQTFGDASDSTSILANPTHTYRDTGTYYVTLIATNTLGCKDTNIQPVIIKPYFTLYIPNSFSPNGDRFNGTFNAVGDYIANYDMKIFDRWGALIFETNNMDTGWNGAKGSGVAEEGVYVYIINVVDTDLNSHAYKGTVTLIK